METVQPRVWFNIRRVVLVAVVAAVLAAAFFTASSLIGPGSAPSTLQQDIKKMEAAALESPNDGGLRLALAALYERAGQTEQALGQFQEVLVLDAENEDALLGAALAHRKLGQSDQAVQALVTIIAQNKDNPYAEVNRRLEAAHYYLGQIYREQGKLDEAINELRTAIGLNRADADALYELGLAFLAKGENADAASAFEVALAYVPDFTEAYQALAQAARANGDETKAKYAEAMMLVFGGKAKDGASQLEKIAPDSNDSRVWWGLGHAQEQAGRPEEARQAYQKAVEINPGERLAADALARLEGSP